MLPEALPCKLEELPKAAARRMRGTEDTYGEAGVEAIALTGVEAIEAVAIESEARVASGSAAAAEAERVDR